MAEVKYVVIVGCYCCVSRWWCGGGGGSSRCSVGGGSFSTLGSAPKVRTFPSSPLRIPRHTPGWGVVVPPTGCTAEIAKMRATRSGWLQKGDLDRG